MVSTELKIDVPKLKQALALINSKINRVLVDALNECANGLKKDWLGLIQDKVKNPTPFTKKIFVSPAKPDNLVSQTFIPDTQSEYLRLMIEGGERKPGDIATLSKSIIIPVPGTKVNKFGNFSQGPKRWLGQLERTYPKAFVGKPRGEESHTAVYNRMKNGRLKLLAIFESMVDYKPTLPIDKVAEDFQSKSNSIFEKKLKEI